MAERLHRTARVLTQRGFSLIEVLVALLVVAIGALAIGALFPTATRDIGVSDRTTRAAEYLQEGLEALTGLSYKDPALRAGIEHFDPRNPLPGGFKRKWRVREDYPLPGCKMLFMEISWSEGQREHKVSASTIIARVGR